MKCIPMAMKYACFVLGAMGVTIPVPKLILKYLILVLLTYNKLLRCGLVKLLLTEFI
jgi:hypothetical protein